jgi:hypothetical protein
MDKDKKINSAKITHDNHDSSCGTWCPLCNFNHKQDELRECIGWSDAPFIDLVSKPHAIVFSCSNCHEIYWYHAEKYLCELFIEYSEE